MALDYSLCFVKVLGVRDCTYKDGEYREVAVIEETGYWFNTFLFNVFPNHKLYPQLQKGLTLFVKVTYSNFAYSNVGIA